MSLITFAYLIGGLVLLVVGAETISRSGVPAR